MRPAAGGLHPTLQRLHPTLQHLHPTLQRLAATATVSPQRSLQLRCTLLTGIMGMWADKKGLVISLQLQCRQLTGTIEITCRWIRRGCSSL